MTARFAVTLSILTPPEPGAIAVLLLQAPDAPSLELAASRAAIPLPPLNSLRLAPIAGVDLGVITRFSDATLHLMPHAGPAVIHEIVRRLEAVGITLARPDSLDPRTLYPEAADDIEARMLWALSQAASPLAIDLLLDQPRRWRLEGATDQRSLKPAIGDTRGDPGRDQILNRLITPPTVAALGPPNIGKSTLCNALAGRSVAIVADEPGTTRDHVGVMIEVGGLVIRYIDTPGMTPRGPRPHAPTEESGAVTITRAILDSADLILLCGDATNPPLPLPSGHPFARTLTLALRADLGPAPFPHDAAVSAQTGQGIPQLATLIRESLVPNDALASPAPWKFWP